MPNRPSLYIVTVIFRVWSLLQFIVGFILFFVFLDALATSDTPAAVAFTMGPIILGTLIGAVLIRAFGELIEVFEVFVSQERLLAQAVNSLRGRD